MKQSNQRGRKQRDENVEFLNAFLLQYVKAKRREERLVQRLNDVQIEMMQPISGINYDPINKPQNQISSGSASFVLRKSEIEVRIYAQKDKVAEALLEIMDVLDYLDENSDQRNALELHYIDDYKWEDAAEEMCVSRSQIYKLREKGLKKLLTYKRVQNIIKKYRERAEEEDG